MSDYMLLDAVSEDEQKTVARIAGAVAHELNNPLQGILSLVGVTLRESRSDERCQARLEQIHRGVTRISRTVESLAAIYENLPRPPDSTLFSTFLTSLSSSLSECGFRVHVRPLQADPVVSGFFPELVRLSTDLFREHSPAGNGLQLIPSEVPGGVGLTFNIDASNSHPLADDEWLYLDDLNGVSGLAILIDEIVRFAGGTIDFKWHDSNLIGMRVSMRFA